MAKYYFSKYHESCYQLNYFKEYMIDKDIKEMELFEAEIEIGNGYFFCTHIKILDVGEVGEGCGEMVRTEDVDIQIIHMIKQIKLKYYGSKC